MEYALAPNDPLVLYNLGLGHAQLGQYQAALPFLQRSLELATRQSDWVRKLLAVLCDVLVRLHRPDEALRITDMGLKNFLNDPELSLRRADLLGKLGDLRGAEACLISLLANPPSDYFMVGVPADAVRKEARRLLGVVYLDQHRYADAERLLRELLAEYPDYLQGYVNLGYVLLALGRLEALETLIQQLTRSPEGDVYAWGLQAELDMVRGEWSRARSLLGQAMARAPRMLWLRLVLSDFLLTTGDRQGYLAVQRDILRLDPGNVVARERLRRIDNASQVLTISGQALSWTVTV
jgi:tetratricopeptide (TPR) repeat protein